MPRQPKPPQVEVEWFDAVGYDSVHGTLGHVLDRAKILLRRTVGYLVHQDEYRTILAHDYDAPTQQDEEPEYGNITVIPTGWVKKTRYLQRRRRAVSAVPESTLETQATSHSTAVRTTDPAE